MDFPDKLPIGKPFRQAARGAQWHYRDDCSQWPCDDYVEAPWRFNCRPVCSECIVRDAGRYEAGDVGAGLPRPELAGAIDSDPGESAEII